MFSTALGGARKHSLCSSFAVRTALRFGCYDELHATSQFPGTQKNNPTPDGVGLFWESRTIEIFEPSTLFLVFPKKDKPIA